MKDRFEEYKKKQFVNIDKQTRMGNLLDTIALGFLCFVFGMMGGYFWCYMVLVK